MAIHDLTEEHLSFHCERIESLTPDTERLWGEMTADRMMRHLRIVTELTLDDPNGEVKVILPPLIRTVVVWLLFDVFTNWPKGKLKSLPLYLPEETLGFEEEKRMLLDICREFASRCEASPGEKHIHPGAGPVTLRRLAHIHGVHMNHHYRQFGLV